MDKKEKLINEYKTNIDNNRPAYYYNGYIWSEVIIEGHQYWFKYYLSECGLNEDGTYYVDYITAKENGIEI